LYDIRTEVKPIRPSGEESFRLEFRQVSGGNECSRGFSITGDMLGNDCFRSR
jgi:hypothetical protein